MKPFSTYPKDRAEMLDLCGTLLQSSIAPETLWEASTRLADLVKAILDDEATPNTYFAMLDEVDAHVQLERKGFDGLSTRWTCYVSSSSGGATLSVYKRGCTADEALEAACMAFFKIQREGMPMAALAASVEARNSLVPAC